MKRISRLVSVLLAIVMACTTLAVTSFADDTYVASVTIDGVTTNYTTIASAFNALSSDTTATITLLCDTSYSGSGLQLNGNVTFDLNGFTLTGTSSTPMAT
ncbi:MAG: hypothetical protein LUF29_10130 [Oscillospiraceae bacterium]|nr:hypothetical protein [Oscillospiraceae bacterium]